MGRENTTPPPRGFAAMDAERRREIARKGGASVPAEKRSFAHDHDLAVRAGRKGGKSVAGENRSFARDRTLAAAAGRKGGRRRRDDGPDSDGNA